ncbi:MAG: PspA/IM30 family protein [Fimbriimonadales bacterium]|nr:PspA/IM30 family protein [Fimbriimonadales bacterium]MDW8051292.1 PspA/IM30 family protein [Armatimonadota bacterium]
MFKALARLWRYLVAWLTGKVEQLEDPEVLLDQARREMQETLARNRERAIQAITQKNILQAEVEKLERTVRDLERKAELALQHGKRDLALQLIREKKAQEGALQSMRASLQQAIETVESIKLAIRRQEEEVRVKTAQALAMKARWKQAQIQNAINKALEGITIENLESVWSAAEQRIQRAEAEAAARQEMAAQSLQGRLAALQDAQLDYEAEQELARIEQRLGLRPAEATTTSAVEESDALRELEELERKLQATQRGDTSATNGT